jgi:hypothetical protein
LSLILFPVFHLDNIVPWGRSFDEYRRMFALTPDDLARTIVGCADGPASFNAELTRRGGRVTSCDPIYRLQTHQIEQRIAATAGQILDETRRNADEFVWSGEIKSVEQLGETRMSAMRLFLDDYDAGGAEGRYVDAELPQLPFEAVAFELALCSHFLFLYSAQLGEDFHHAALRELCRVAGEVRVFPLVALGGERSPLVEPCAVALQASGHIVSIEAVPYEFQRGADQMMRVRAKGDRHLFRRGATGKGACPL